MPEIRAYPHDCIRIGEEWPMCLDLRMDGYQTLVFTGMIANDMCTNLPACGVQIRRYERHFAVIFLKYSDTEVPEEWRASEMLWEHRPQEWGDDHA